MRRSWAAIFIGVSPSYYEPWGYTPLETAALGVPSITTDLAGFGRFLNKQQGGKSGIYILERYGKQYEEMITQFTGQLYDYAQLRQPQRVQEKIAAKRFAAMADWSLLVNNYLTAYDIAMKNKFGG